MINPLFIKNKRLLNLVLIAGLLILNITSASAGNISKDKIIELANQTRSEQKLLDLHENALLNLAAQKKANDMLSDNYFDHYSQDGNTPWDFILSTGYDYAFAGENLAMDFATSEGVHRAWMNSPTHAKNISSNNFSDIGVAVVDGNLDGHQTTLVVQMFGSERQSVIKFSSQSNLVKTINNLLGFEFSN